ncbi:MAG: outer membrane lipoprotein-sorting protein [Fidelibacterota bacterium]|nr:MAG: outer membrane lipoprotein-sorting protein [Candidatus Neomarinimicrobiota bacterium]
MRNCMRWIWLVTLALAGGITYGQSPDATGIMTAALTGSAWQDMQADMKLILRTTRGEERVRDVAFFSSDTEEDLSRMLMRFLSPADVKGTGFLTLETASGEDERYLYLPALRRVKKIAASGSGGNFMSSDFTYYDIGEPKLEDWVYSLVGEDIRDGRPHHIIECLPASEDILKDTGYGKIVRWVDQETLNIPYSEIYDRGQSKWKVLDVLSFERIGDVDFASDMVMRDIQTGHSSEITFSNIEVDQGIPDEFFTVRYLQRGR